MQIDTYFIEIALPNVRPISIRIDAIESISVSQVYGRNNLSLEIKGSGGTTLYSFEGADAQLYYNKLIAIIEPHRFQPDTTPLPKVAATPPPAAT